MNKRNFTLQLMKEEYASFSYHCGRKNFTATFETSSCEGVALGTIHIKDLLRQGVVEYIDVNEENNCLIEVAERELKVRPRAIGEDYKV